MGQYYKAVNLTKKQFITPHQFGDGAKLMEFALSGEGMMSALAILLADGNGRGFSLSKLSLHVSLQDMGFFFARIPQCL